MDENNRVDADRHFELARRQKASGNPDYRYNLLRAMKPAETEFVPNADGVQFRFAHPDIEGTQVWAQCAAHSECPSVARPSKANMPYCDVSWWPRTKKAR